MDKLVLNENPEKRFITCFYNKDNTGNLIKQVKVYSADYRQKVVNHLIKEYAMEYIYMEDEPYKKLEVPHMKYCREMNTDSDEYSWYKMVNSSMLDN